MLSSSEQFPALPLNSYGELPSARSPGKSLYYALDKNYEIWLGLQKGKEVVLEHFVHNLAFDVLYNYNILSWIKVSRIIPSDVYNKLRGISKEE